MNQLPESAAIAALNDRFRKEGPSRAIPGQAVMTTGIAALPLAERLRVQRAVAEFDRFTEADDLYGEHDFGAVEVEGAGKVFWKIDYYAPDMELGSDDPANTAKTVRVLTIMLASEY